MNKMNKNKRVNIFVAGWYFPPTNSSESIVTYKLLKNSAYDYDVFCSQSELWSYKNRIDIDAENITVYSIKTDNIDEWVQWCIEQFEIHYKEKKYDCIMTRSTPEESILVGKAIKKAHPEIKWIDSHGDPVANNPYELQAYIIQNPALSDKAKKTLISELKNHACVDFAKWMNYPGNGIKVLIKKRGLEDDSLQNADMIIAPSKTQLEYEICGRQWNEKYYPVPHTYDRSLYPNNEKNGNKRVRFLFTGYSNQQRSVKPVVDAINYLKEANSAAIDGLEVVFAGNIYREIQDQVIALNLGKYISFTGSQDYLSTLRMMKEADWLIHVDAIFDNLDDCGQVFFAAKIADYIGARRPILALTLDESPASDIVKKYGGVVVNPKEIKELASVIERIVLNNAYSDISETTAKMYDAEVVAARFDKRVSQLIGYRTIDDCLDKSVEPSTDTDRKLLSVCVPSYNVEDTLNRCLNSLLRTDKKKYLDIMIVNDGSKDLTEEIGSYYQNNFPNIVRLFNKTNGGHGSTINMAIENAVGKYFMVVDGDDWVDEINLSKLLKLILSEETKADIISSNYNLINASNGESKLWEQECKVVYNEDLPLETIDTNKVYFTLASSAFKTECLKKCSEKLDEHTYYVDVEYILFPIPYIHRTRFLEDCIYKYCQGNENQSIHIPNMVKRYDDHTRVVKRVIEYMNSSKMDESQNEYFKAIIKRVLYTQYALSMVYDDNRERGLDRAKEFDEYLRNRDEGLWNWAGDSIPGLKYVRKKRFDSQKVKTKDYVNWYGESHLINTGKGFRPIKSVLRKLLYNRVTFSIWNSKLIPQEKKEEIKKLVKNNTRG